MAKRIRKGVGSNQHKDVAGKSIDLTNQRHDELVTAAKSIRSRNAAGEPWEDGSFEDLPGVAEGISSRPDYWDYRMCREMGASHEECVNVVVSGCSFEDFTDAMTHFRNAEEALEAVKSGAHREVAYV